MDKKNPLTGPHITFDQLIDYYINSKFSQNPPKKSLFKNSYNIVIHYTPHFTQFTAIYKTFLPKTQKLIFNSK